MHINLYHIQRCLVKCEEQFITVAVGVVAVAVEVEQFNNCDKQRVGRMARISTEQ